MIVNNVELEDLDILDADVAEKYEKSLDKFGCISDKLEGMRVSESIRTQCGAIFEVFNTLFGEGTDKKVFGDRVNLLTCLKAFEELVLQINEQKKELEKFTNKYSSNRAAKRSRK